jgi:glucose/arabinose dehydrogenase
MDFTRLVLVLTLPALACGGTAAPLAATPRPDSPPMTVAPPATDVVPLPPPTKTQESPVASAFPEAAAYTWSVITQALTRPVDIQHAGDGSGRVFIVEQPGRIRVLVDGQLLEAPLLDITERVDDSSNEQGLLGLAFHPDYENNGFFYLNYTRNGGDTIIARYQVTGNPNIADPNSEFKLLDVSQPFPNHNGGAVAFGPDGYLYLGLGDGGAGGDPFGNAQSVNTLLGKVLRIDVNAGDPYAIPPDNPFANGGGRPEVWTYGLRNPWRLSFDRATGDMFIGDVGQGAWEEVDFLTAGSSGGANYGWDYREGAHAYEGNAPAGLVDPVAEYSHDVGGCSITGGYVYRGPSLPEWQGVYFYGDYCSGFVWGLIPSALGWQSRLLFETGARISGFGEDEAGELYLANLQGAVYRLVKR